MFMFEQEQENPPAAQQANNYQWIARRLFKKKNLLHTTLSSIPPILCYVAGDDNQPDSSSNNFLKVYYGILLSSLAHRYFLRKVNDDLMNAVTGLLMTMGYIELFSSSTGSGLLLMFIAITVNRFASTQPQERNIVLANNFDHNYKMLEGMMLFAYTLDCTKYVNNKIFTQHALPNTLNLEQDTSKIYGENNGAVKFPAQQIEYDDDASYDQYRSENNNGPT
ncbi:MAG: hypothetical protein GY821_03535 [Gammaproteobacteria bacterium]|nr:hypothetical protein [Gammaproteobacteria bacterium]